MDGRVPVARDLITRRWGTAAPAVKQAVTARSVAGPARTVRPVRLRRCRLAAGVLPGCSGETVPSAGLGVGRENEMGVRRVTRHSACAAA